MLFRVPVEGVSPIQVTGVRRGGDGAQIDFAFDGLPADAELFAIFGAEDLGTSIQQGRAVPLGSVPAAKTGKASLAAPVPGSEMNLPKVLRVFARMPGANLVWWSDVLRP